MPMTPVPVDIDAIKTSLAAKAAQQVEARHVTAEEAAEAKGVVSGINESFRKSNDERVSEFKREEKLAMEYDANLNALGKALMDRQVSMDDVKIVALETGLAVGLSGATLGQFPVELSAAGAEILAQGNEALDVLAAKVNHRYDLPHAHTKEEALNLIGKDPRAKKYTSEQLEQIAEQHAQQDAAQLEEVKAGNQQSLHLLAKYDPPISGDPNIPADKKLGAFALAGYGEGQKLAAEQQRAAQEQQQAFLEMIRQAQERQGAQT